MQSLSVQSTCPADYRPPPPTNPKTPNPPTQTLKDGDRPCKSVHSANSTASCLSRNWKVLSRRVLKQGTTYRLSEMRKKVDVTRSHGELTSRRRYANKGSYESEVSLRREKERRRSRRASLALGNDESMAIIKEANNTTADAERNGGNRRFLPLIATNRS